MQLDLYSTPEYREVLRRTHAVSKWGQHGASHAETITTFARDIGAVTILDYGCGAGTLAKAMPLSVREYDPGISGKDILPEPADLVVCTDVLEHVEPHLLDSVLLHIRRLSLRGVFLIVALVPSRVTLVDGRNSHLIVQSRGWWLQKIKEHFTIVRAERRKGLWVWAR